MPSWSARAAAGMLRALNARRVWADPAEAEKHLRTLATRPLRYAPPKRLLRSDVAVEAGRFGGWPVYTLRPKSAPAAGAMVYAHGGGWVHEIHSLHWRFVAQVVTEAHVTAIVPIYPLAPFGTAGQVVPVVADLAEKAREEHGPLTVSYTHLDVYKRQVIPWSNVMQPATTRPVSYTHLDVYKRQHQRRGGPVVVPVVGEHDAREETQGQDVTCLLYTSRCV